MKKIVSFGDSFVYGSELQNNTDGTQAWAGLIAKQLGVDYQTYSVPGCGNENITRQILTYFSNNSADNTLAIINWTWCARWDFYIPNIEQWTTLGLTCVPDKLAPLVGQQEAENILDFYNKYPGHSTLWDKYRTLQTIFTSQQFLKKLGVANVQTYMDYEMLDQQWHAPDYIITLQDLVKDSLELFEGKNFLDWSRANGHFITDPGWHPLESAHNSAKNLWITQYANLLNL